MSPKFGDEERPWDMGKKQRSDGIMGFLWKNPVIFLGLTALGFLIWVYYTGGGLL